jgi:hypothetical protein
MPPRRAARCGRHLEREEVLTQAPGIVEPGMIHTRLVIPVGGQVKGDAG